MAGIANLYTANKEQIEVNEDKGKVKEELRETKFDKKGLPELKNDVEEQEEPELEEGFGIEETEENGELVPYPDSTDSFLTGLINLEEKETLLTPRGEKMLYRVKVDNEEVTRVIEDAIKANKDRVSFSTEELGLNNRVLNLEGIKRESNLYFIVKSPKGNIVVIKNRDRNEDSIKEFNEEATTCAKAGKRISIKLTEDYEIKDEHGRTLTRERFRASLSEIKRFIRGTKMKGQITEDSFLIIYE